MVYTKLSLEIQRLNVAEGIGTAPARLRDAGYVSTGPFLCGTCRYLKDSDIAQEALSDAAYCTRLRAYVERSGCCGEWAPG